MTIPRCLLFLCFFWCVGASPWDVSSPVCIRRRATPLQLLSRGGAASSSSDTAAPPPPPPPPQLLRVVETEVWGDHNDWRGAKPRWTLLETGRSCVAPPQMEPPNPERQEFDGDWKIVTTRGRSDRMGWEYSDTGTLRKRIWLRTIVPKKKKRVVVIAPEEETTKQKSISAKKRRRSSRLSKFFSNEFHFKGLAFSFYKSIIFLSSFGVAMRLPLLSNFDWWDRRPYLPSVTTAVSLYHPFMAVYYISLSIHMETMQYLLMNILFYLRLACMTVLLYTRHLFLQWPTYLFYQLLLRRNNNNNKSPPQSPKLPIQPKIQQPNYSLVMQQRIGCTISWRVSQARPGSVEFRFSQWMEYLPTLLHLLKQQQELWKINNPNMTPQSLLLRWIQKHSGALGCVVGRPIPDHPKFSFSGVLSLSGFYFFRRRKAIKEEEVPQQQHIQQQPRQILTTPVNNSTKSAIAMDDETKGKQTRIAG